MRSTTPTSVRRRPSATRTLASAVLALGVLTLTACGSSGTATASGTSTAQSTSTTSASPVAAPTGASGTGGSGSTGSTSGSTGSTGGSSGTSGSTGSTGGGGTGTDTDSYAWSHPCDDSQLSVHVAGGNTAGRRVIEVHNNGSHACGLSYFPLVYLDDSASADQSQAVKPLVPGGLGGAPAYALHAGTTAYAVIDLDPSGAAGGTSGVNELNVLADGSHMPNADTHNFPLSAGTTVSKPKLGLYEDSVSAAVASMTQANTQS